MRGKFFGAKGDSADEQSGSQDEQGAAQHEQGAAQGEQPVAAVVAPVATVTQDGVPAYGWATLGAVPVAQCVPASPKFAAFDGQLSPVTAATVARMLGTDSSQSSSS